MKKAAVTFLSAIVVPVAFLVAFFLISLLLTLISKIPILGTLVLRFLIIEGSSASWFACIMSLGASLLIVSFFEESTKLKNGMTAGSISSGITMFALGILLTVGGVSLSQSFWSILNYLAVAAFGVYLIIVGARGH